jgi:hypothetical protein
MTPLPELSDSGASVRRALLETLANLNAGGSCGSGLVAGELAILTGCFGSELDVQLRVLEHEQVIESNSEPLFPGAARLTRYRLRAER